MFCILHQYLQKSFIVDSVGLRNQEAKQLQLNTDMTSNVFDLWYIKSFEGFTFKPSRSVISTMIILKNKIPL